ncbi:vWA domain-containing protein [Cryobacterium sp. TMT2-17-1]|uniref:vWA domain-containing protein n=1 Tax=Cryobacterium sp. TMT2-17-1 TaxID=1259248 RepID=UPI00141ABB7D|nr:vWA domain-containing protein [Cryobacterium sp. TMT2-17-1]
MTDPNYTALLLVIDRSGSMSGIRDDMVGGLTAMLAAQAAEPGLLTVDIVTFDDEIEHTHTLADPSDIAVELDPRGMTALHDAIGIAVTEFGETLRVLPEHARPGTVQVVVVTDGGENSSSEYSADAVRALINRQTESYSWDFVFLGANQDAVLTGAALGFDSASSMTFAAASGEVAAMSANLGRYVTDVRKKEKRGFTFEERIEAGGDGV